MKTALSAFCLAALLAGSVHAQGTPAPRPADKRVLSILANTTEELRPQVAEVIRNQQKKLGGCAELTRLDADEIWVVSDVTFFDSGNPAAGRWQVRYTATLCGQQVSRNVTFQAGSGAGSGVAVEAAMPGQTLADPQLAADVWRSYQLAALKTVPSCQTPLLKETQVIEQPATPTSIWRELWIARACDRDLAQVISFYPSKAGTLFRMALPEKPMDAIVSRTVPTR